MADFGDKLASLPALTLRELRVLASRIGLGRYGALTRRSLMEAIRSRINPATGASGNADTTATDPDPAVAFTASPAPSPIAAVEAAAVPAGDEGVAVAAAATDSRPSDATAPGLLPLSHTWIAVQPQGDRWAEVRWQLSEADAQALQAAGASGLKLRLADVNGQVDGSALPHALQELSVDSGAVQWYLPIPLGDRSYRVELGYRLGAPDGWRTLAISGSLYVPAAPQEACSEVWNLPFTLEAQPMAPAPAAPVFSGSEPHEQLYQIASIAWRRNAVGSEAFMERSELGAAEGAEGFHASGQGLWASGLQDSGAGGVPARQRSFWLVADAELIVHAATEPSALLKVGDAPHALSEEGTIRIHVPFPDGDQHYPITAIAADGEQKRNVTLSFQRTTPHARVNRREEAVAEWF